jgi:hypothetical protein
MAGQGGAGLRQDGFSPADTAGLPSLFGIRQNPHPLALQEILHGLLQPRMAQVMPRPRDHRLEPANQFVLALGTGVETLQPWAMA